MDHVQAMPIAQTAHAGMSSKSKRTPRRWPSFSLRSLLIAITLCAMFMAFWVNGARRQRVAVAALERIGSNVSYDDHALEHGRPLGRLNGADSVGPDIKLDRSSWAPRLLQSWLGRDYFHNAIMVFYGESHFISPPRAGAADGFREIAHLRHVELIQVSSEVTDDDVSHLAGLPRLRALIVIPHCPQLTDDALRTLSRIESLEMLHLNNAHITDLGARHLANMPHLRYLKLGSTTEYMVDQSDVEITDDGLARLASLKNLVALTVGSNSTKLSRSGVEPLMELQHLKYLQVVGPEMTYYK